jgi:hypothetical protein
MVCPSCNKFPAFEIAEPELDGLECEAGVVTGTVRLFLTTECCGDEAKENIFDIELDMTDSIELALKGAGVAEPDLDAEGVTFEVVSESADGGDRYQFITPKGKPIKARYQKHFYTVDVGVTILVTYPVPDGEPIEVSVDGAWSDEIQASSMEELC